MNAQANMKIFREKNTEAVREKWIAKDNPV
jgi:hypothetical protein